MWWPYESQQSIYLTIWVNPWPVEGANSGSDVFWKLLACRLCTAESTQTEADKEVGLSANLEWKGGQVDQYLNCCVLCYISTFVITLWTSWVIGWEEVGRILTCVFAAQSLCTSYTAPSLTLCISHSLTTENNCKLRWFYLPRTQKFSSEKWDW